MDAAALEVDAVKFAKLAVINDQTGKYKEAVFYYKVGILRRCHSNASILLVLSSLSNIF